MKELTKFSWQNVSSAQKELRKAYLQGNLKVATELFETLKIFYRAYIQTKKIQIKKYADKMNCQRSLRK